MITLETLSKSYGSRTLFDIEDTVTFSPGNRYALTGPNGAGKSTLLKVIAGAESATSGTVKRPDSLSFLRQDIDAFTETTVTDAVIMGNARLWKALAERNKLYEEEITDAIGMRLGELEEIVAEEDGYTADSMAEDLLIGMGVEAEFHHQIMGEIPTDKQFRVLLCQSLFGNPQALLLDEPTNHLDLESIGWLETFLHDYTGTLIIVSHDRHFINSVATHVADIDYDTIIVYPGDYDNMVLAKTATRDRADHEAKSKEKKIAKLREFVAKFGAGTRASQVQSRKREMERLQPQDLKASNIQRPYIRFPVAEKQPGKLVLKVEGISKTYENDPVIQNFSYEFMRDDKVAVIGSNGRGKTTLLKMLANAIPPDTGSIELGHQAIINYFPQHHGDIVNKTEETELFSWLRERRHGLYDQEIRSAMGKLLFAGDDAFKRVCDLSGGETARLIISGMMLNNHNILILDEPNNHLDLEAVSALAWGLQDYKGCVILASHDRELLADVATRVIAIEEDGIHFYEGTVDEYRQQR